MDVAAARPDPIPVFAEMSSTNPVFILPGALREKSDAIASGLHASVTIGAGQFCTKPGMVFLPEGVSDEPFIAGLQKLVHESKQFNLLTAGIRSAYKSNIARRKTEKGVKLSAERTAPAMAMRSASIRCFSKPMFDDSCRIRNWRRKCSAQRHS